MPALATSTSTGPSSASTRSKAASTSAPEVTSHGTVRSPSTSPLRDVTATRSPAASKARATARPIPRLPPVTNTTRPLISDPHGVEAAVDVEDLARGHREQVRQQGHAGPGHRLGVGDVPAERGPFVPDVLEAGEPRDALGRHRPHRPG